MRHLPDPLSIYLLVNHFVIYLFIYLFIKSIYSFIYLCVNFIKPLPPLLLQASRVVCLCPLRSRLPTFLMNKFTAFLSFIPQLATSLATTWLGRRSPALLQASSEASDTGFRLAACLKAAENYSWGTISMIVFHPPTLLVSSRLP